MRKLRALFENKTFVTVFRWIIAFLIGISLFCVIFFLNTISLTDACNACFAPGALLLALGLLSLGNKHGAFDFAEYGFASAASSLRRNYIPEYEDLMDFKEKKKMNRMYSGPVYLPYFVLGAVFLALAILFYILYKVM